MSGKLTLCELLAKKEERLVQGERKKDDCGGFIVFLITVSAKQKF